MLYSTLGCFEGFLPLFKKTTPVTLECIAVAVQSSFTVPVLRSRKHQHQLTKGGEAKGDRAAAFWNVSTLQSTLTADTSGL